MFCPKCGTELPDGVRFCSKCGSSLAAQAQSVQVPEQMLAQPQQQYYASKPLPQQPQYNASQPRQYGMVQYAPAQARAPMNPAQRKKIITISACLALLTAFLLVLFLAIIPNAGGKGKLKHIWADGDPTSRYTMTIDLKNKTMSYRNQTIPLTDWSVDGSMFTLSYMDDGDYEVFRYYYMLSKSGDYLVFFDIDTEEDLLDDPDVKVLKRMD